jgi:hypothetical protein
MTSALLYVLIEWSDHWWSFEYIDSATNRTIFSSHVWNYPLYCCESDTRHAIDICEQVRAKVQGCSIDELGTVITTIRRPRRQRLKEQVAAEDRLLKLLQRSRRVYSKRDWIVDNFRPAAA